MNTTPPDYLPFLIDLMGCKEQNQTGHFFLLLREFPELMNRVRVLIQIAEEDEPLLARWYQAIAFQAMVSCPTCEEKTFSFYDNYEYYQFTLKRLKDNMFRMITYDKKEYLLSDSKKSFEVSPNSKDVFIQLKGKGKPLPTRPYQAKAFKVMVSDPSCKEKTFSFCNGSREFTLKRLKDNMFLMITEDKREHLLSDSKTSFEVDY